MKLYPHKSYDEYRNKNIEINKKKINNVRPQNCIEPLVKYLLKHNKTPKFGLCHGVRNGWEVKAFRHYLKIDVIGTDISPTATQFKHCIEWDFHNIKDEWINKFDFIYSNSLDHSHSPRYAVAQWIKCLQPNGLCFVEWGLDKQTGVNAADCFSATYDEYLTMFREMGIFKDVVKFGDYKNIVLSKVDGLEEEYLLKGE